MRVYALITLPKHVNDYPFIDRLKEINSVIESIALKLNRSFAERLFT